MRIYIEALHEHSDNSLLGSIQRRLTEMGHTVVRDQGERLRAMYQAMPLAGEDEWHRNYFRTHMHQPEAINVGVQWRVAVRECDVFVACTLQSAHYSPMLGYAAALRKPTIAFFVGARVLAHHTALVLADRVCVNEEQLIETISAYAHTRVDGYTPKYQIGDRVSWRSQAGGIARTKQGTIAVILPAKVPLVRAVTNPDILYALRHNANAATDHRYVIAAEDGLPPHARVSPRPAYFAPLMRVIDKYGIRLDPVEA